MVQTRDAAGRARTDTAASVGSETPRSDRAGSDGPCFPAQRLDQGLRHGGAIAVGADGHAADRASHQTPKSPPLGLGPDVTDQLPPAQRLDQGPPTRIAVGSCPPPRELVGLVHDTPRNQLRTPGFGLRVTDQLPPTQGLDQGLFPERRTVDADGHTAVRARARHAVEVTIGTAQTRLALGSGLHGGCSAPPGHPKRPPSTTAGLQCVSAQVARGCRSHALRAAPSSWRSGRMCPIDRRDSNQKAACQTTEMAEDQNRRSEARLCSSLHLVASPHWSFVNPGRGQADNPAVRLRATGIRPHLSALERREPTRNQRCQSSIWRTKLIDQ